MKQIDRVMIKAKNLSGNQAELCAAFVMPNGKGWSAVGHIWDGKKDHAPCIDSSLHSTMDGAVQSLYGLAERYHGGRDIAFIICDV